MMIVYALVDGSPHLMQVESSLLAAQWLAANIRGLFGCPVWLEKFESPATTITIRWHARK